MSGATQDAFEMSWSSIAGAPRDGTRILLWDGKTVCVGAWFYAGCWCNDGWHVACDMAGNVPQENYTNQGIAVIAVEWCPIPKRQHGEE